ncbi:MAG: hypothetical protein RSA29_10540 [Clostridium sp.]|uniref:hypothetical protein n=1 Tax=Clostridium sp. TaxID=1506 RepID=UPI002FC68529
MDRIYLGAIIDINKEQYLPIMTTQTKVINFLQSPFRYFNQLIELKNNTIIMCFSDTSFTGQIKILKGNTLETVNTKIITNKLAAPYICGTVSINEQFFYTITVINTNYYLTKINLITMEESNSLLNIGITSSTELNTISSMFIDNTYIYIVNQRGIILKLNIESNTITAASSAFAFLNYIYRQDSIAFDNNYLYIPYNSTEGAIIEKIDKNTLLRVASSSKLFTNVNAAISQIVYNNGFLYIKSNSTSEYTILKLNPQTMSIVVSNKQNYVDCIYLTIDGRIFATKYNSSDCGFYELDKNTLSILYTSVSSTSHGYSTGVYHNVSSGRTLIMAKTSIITQFPQFERVYTIESYKKISENII